ncbi:tetratricopeptide repeat protein, partial [bacterium]|nr:tetratricopeptide repeat protein [bacterium]
MLNKDSQENSNIVNFERCSKNRRLSKLKRQSALLQEKGRFAEAADALKSAVNLEQDNDELHIDLGLTLARLNRFEEAIPHFRAACDLNSDKIEAYYYLGLACSQVGLHKKALDCWKHCLNAKYPDIDEYELRLRLSETYADLKRYQKALYQLVEHVIKFDPFNLDAYNSLAMLFLHISKLPPEELDDKLASFTPEQYQDMAKSCLLKNLKRSPNYYYTHLCLGTMYMEQGFLDMAIREFKIACKNNPEDSAPLISLAHALAMRGSIEEACEALEKGLGFDDYDDESLFFLGSLEVSLDRTEKAESRFKQILERSPGHIPSINALGVMELNRRNLEEAKKYFLKSLDINPEYAAS